MAAELQIDFENRVGKCEFRPAVGMSDEKNAYDGGSILPVGKLKKVRASSTAMQDAVRLLIEHEKSSQPFHELVLQLVQTIGIHGEPNYGDRIFTWKLVAQRLRWIAEGVGYPPDNAHGLRKKVEWPHPYAQDVGQLGIYLVPDEQGKPVLAVRPKSLQDALILYAARMRANGTTFQQCEHCHVPFLSGGPEGRGGGRRRGDARFCSDDCRYGYHNELRRKTARKGKL
jgi:hypothetical protein